MANTKSSKKDIRRTARRTERNLVIKSRLKTLSKKVKVAVADGDVEKIKACGADYVSALDKASKSGIVHKNKCANAKSKLSLNLNKLAKA